jgi:chemotaxis protein methyltransferase WspC
MSGTAAVETWLREHTGLDAATLGQGVVARAVCARLGVLHCKSQEDYLIRLANSAEERLQLIERVVVPETWFFRDRAALEAVARHAVDTWAPAHPGRTFHVLCVPCATGEEPYSLAMAFAQAGWPLERLEIAAFDISRENIARAREGLYRKNSFRGADLQYRNQYLEPVGPDMWRVNGRVRAPVKLAEGNLFASGFAARPGGYEAIFCRNLLIYFDRPTQTRAVTALSALLAPGGLFAVGPAEPVLLLEYGFSVVKAPGAFLLERERPRAAPPVSAKPIRARVRRTTPPFPKTKLPRAIPASPRVPAPAPASDTVETIQALADAGKLAEAAARGEALLAREPTAGLVYLLGVIADGAGQPARAEGLYRKALYLDPHHPAALAHLALHHEQRGDHRSARALRARAQRTLSKESA